MRLLPARLVLAVAVAAAMTTSAAPAMAQTPSPILTGPDSAYYVGSVTAIEPATTGLTFSIAGGGDSITLTDTTGQEVIVLGYANEPYLRFTAKGVDENTSSLSTALNNGQAPQQGAGGPAQTAATWKHVSDTASWTWSDLRIRWNATERPPVVAQDEHSRHRVFEWALPITVDGTQSLVHGAVDWTGTPLFSAVQLGVIGGVAIAVVIIASTLLLLTRRSRPRDADLHPSSDATPTGGTSTGVTSTGGTPNGGPPLVGVRPAPSLFDGTPPADPQLFDAPAPAQQLTRRMLRVGR